VFANASLTERLENTGILTEGIAWDHAVIGVVGRASGIDRDLRRDRPFAAYDVLQPKVALYRYGDVRARMRVRLDEIHESIRLIREVRRTVSHWAGSCPGRCTKHSRGYGRCRRSKDGEARFCMSSWPGTQVGFTAAKCAIRPS
jgi:Ni,Fe-hydrogenase III large subunit